MHWGAVMALAAAHHSFVGGATNSILHSSKLRAKIPGAFFVPPRAFWYLPGRCDTSGDIRVHPWAFFVPSGLLIPSKLAFILYRWGRDAPAAGHHNFVGGNLTGLGCSPYGGGEPKRPEEQTCPKGRHV